MMHDVFGDIEFTVGWKTNKSIVLFGHSYVVTVKIQAYLEEDGITKEQENAYINFLNTEEIKMYWEATKRVFSFRRIAIYT